MLDHATIGKALSPGSLRRMPSGIGCGDGLSFVSSFVSNRCESHVFSPVVTSLAGELNCPKKARNEKNNYRWELTRVAS